MGEGTRRHSREVVFAVTCSEVRWLTVESKFGLFKIGGVWGERGKEGASSQGNKLADDSGKLRATEELRNAVPSPTEASSYRT